MPWLRLWTDIIDDEKLGLLAFEDRWHYVAILCMKRRGILDAGDSTELRDRKVGMKLGLGDADRDAVRRRLLEIHLIDENWQPLAWSKRQPPSDIDSTAAERQRRHREKTSNGHVTRDSPVTHGHVTRESPGSESESESESKIGQTPSAFDRFWSVYPKKVKRKTAQQIWVRKRLDAKAEALLADIAERSKSDRRWLEGFIPDPTTYLNGERWTDEREAPKTAGGGNGLPFASL